MRAQVSGTSTIREEEEGNNDTSSAGGDQGPSAVTLSSSASSTSIADMVNFMPKVTKLRADGASLHDIYLSKKQDFWGKIIKAQFKEEVSFS